MNDASAATFENSRDRHLFGPGPKRILALDGGGVRGALTVAFLERIEALLSERDGKDIRLGEYFDLIGGTSTGAVIAGALALGYAPRSERVLSQARAVRLQAPALARPAVAGEVRRPRPAPSDRGSGRRPRAAKFRPHHRFLHHHQAHGHRQPLDHIEQSARALLGERHRRHRQQGLPAGQSGARQYGRPAFFRSGVLPISRNQTLLPDAMAKPLNVPWLASAVQALLRRLGFGRQVKIDPGTYGLFVDGGVTPHNNPALALFQMATWSPFNIKWPTGPDSLSVISVGTGTYRPRLSYESLGFARFTKLAFHALISLMTDTEKLVMAMMQWMGECPEPWQINLRSGSWPRTCRRAARCSLSALRRAVGKGLAHTQDRLPGERRSHRALRGMDDPAAVHELHEIGRLAAEKQVKIEHLTG